MITNSWNVLLVCFPSDSESLNGFKVGVGPGIGGGEFFGEYTLTCFLELLWVGGFGWCFCFLCFSLAAQFFFCWCWRGCVHVCICSKRRTLIAVGGCKPPFKVFSKPHLGALVLGVPYVGL